MTSSAVTSKGQVTIPKEVREKLRIKPKDRVTFSVEGDHAILHAIHGDIRDLKGLFHRKGMKPIDFKALRRKFERSVAEDVVRVLRESRSR